MRNLLLLSLVLALVPLPARAAGCASGWRVDHYVHDAALHRDWAVLVNCAHPAAPARMQITSQRDAGITTPLGERWSGKPTAGNSATVIGVKAGAAVEVLGPANGMVNMRLSGTAMQTASLGQTIRVRLNPEGYFVHAVVRGPSEVVLVAAKKLSWRQP